MSTLMQASRQWATRPSDQRFTSLLELQAAVEASHSYSKSVVVPSRSITVMPEGTDHKSLAVVGANGGIVYPTHWSFGQLSGLAGAPAGYLRKLPAEIAADNLNYGLKVARDAQDVGVLLYKNGGAPELRAATGPAYGRIWNKDIVGPLVQRFGDGRTGDFRVPGEFGKAVDITKQNTTLFASDRDMFVFLADEEHRIVMKGRRPGESGSLARGFFVWNSEVGSSTFGIALFLFDYVCCNRIVWGAQQYQEIRIRHTASAATHLEERVIPALDEYSRSSTAGVEQAIAAAQRKKIDDLDKFLSARFTRPQVAAIKATHMEEENRPIETLWDATTAVTAYAKGIQWQDERVKLEREGGKILQLAANTLPNLAQAALDGDFEVIEE